jgi:hypothetical protein
MRALVLLSLVLGAAVGCKKEKSEPRPVEKVEKTERKKLVEKAPGELDSPSPPPLPMGTSGESRQQSYTTGHVLIQGAHATYEITGAMIVNVDDHWAKIDKGGEDVWFVPRESVVYIGQKLK